MSQLRLDPREELPSLLKRIKSSSDETVELILPDRSIAGQSLTNLKLLQDESSRLGKRITIISDQPQVQALAKRAGLPVGVEEVVDQLGFKQGHDVGLDGMPVVQEPVVKKDAPKVTHAEAAPRLVKHSKPVPFLWVALGVAVVLLLAGTGGLYVVANYVPKADVVLFTQERTISRDFTVQADPNATAVDAKNLVVPATSLSVEETKTQSFPTSGKKDIGTKAKGGVTFYNQTNQPKSLAAGTILTANKLSFTLDNAVTVPAATMDVQLDPLTLKQTNTTTPGTVDGTITATALGTDSNLDAKTTFVVGSYDSTTLLARNSAALAGGTKQTVSIMTADDKSGAVDTLTQDLQDSTLASLKAKVGAGQTLLNDALTQDVVSSQASNAVGDQVDKFTVTVKMSAAAPAIQENDLKKSLSQAILDKVPDGYKLDANNESLDSHVLKSNSDGTVNLTTTLTAQVIPNVDTHAMLEAIKGKPPVAVENYLKSQPNLNGYKITLTPKLPGPFYHLPSVESHITIEVQVKK